MANYNYTPLNGGQYLDMEGLTTFWTLLKQYISTENAKQNGTNIFIDDSSSDSITDKINGMLQSIQNIDGRLTGVSNSYVSSIKGVGGDYIKITPTEGTKGDVTLTIDDSDLKDFIDSTSAEKKVKSLSIEGDDDIDVTIESDDNDTTNGYVGNVSVKIDSSKLSGRVSALETDTVKGVSATDSKDGGNDYVNISSSEADGVVSIVLDDQKLSQAIAGIDTSYKDYTVNGKQFSTNNGSVILDSTDIKHGSDTISEALTNLSNKVVVTKIESGDGENDLVKIAVSPNSGDVSISIDETNLATQLASAGDHSNLISSAKVEGSDSNTVELSVEKSEQELKFVLNTSPLTTKLSGVDEAIGDINDEITDIKEAAQQNYGNTVHSIGGLKGDVLLSNSTEAGAISFSTNENTISGNVVGLGNAAYDNFIECTEEQILAIIGEIPSSPNPGTGGEDASGEDNSELLPGREK